MMTMPLNPDGTQASQGPNNGEATANGQNPENQ